MKAMTKGLIAALLLLASGTVALGADNAPIQDEPLPPEVKALIGMKIPPVIKDREPGRTPKFIRFSEGMLNRQIGNETPKAELGYEEGIIGEKWPVFIVSAVHKDLTIEILDIHLLPKNLINWRYINGEVKRLEKGIFYIFSVDCLYREGNERIIFGLEDPKVERDGMSTRIIRAWEVDQQNGHIKSISTRNITCAILGE